MRTIRSKPLVVSSAAVVLSLFSACQDTGPRRLRPVVRVGEERGEITATIGDETRYLLADIPRAPVLIGARREVPAEGELIISRVVPPVLAWAERLVVTSKVSVGGHAWRDLAPQTVPVVAGGRRGTFEFRPPLAEDWRGHELRFHATAWAPPDRSASERSRSIQVPDGAILELGGGVVEAGSGRGDVRFALSACRAEDCRQLMSETVDDSSARWSDWRIDLSDFAGDEIELVFETEIVGAAAAKPLFAVWSRPTLYAPTPAREPGQRPNVILLSIDTLRADHLTSYGHKRDTAPKLRERFEKGGVLFENAVAAATTTGPSHMTMLTSLTPTVHGVAERPGVRPPAPITLAEVMRSHGYATGAVTEDGPLHAGWGFSRGFDAYAENKSADVMLPEGHVAATFGKAEEWLRRNLDKPFFLFLHTFEVHYPYTPPARYSALFRDTAPDAGLPPEYAPALYDREIRHVDDQLDELIKKLETAGLLEHTIFIVTSDHGEEFLEHGHIGHGGYLNEEVLHVPLLAVGPGIAPGRRIAAPVAHTDLMPTILDLVGIPAADVMMGRSLAAVMRGEATDLAEVPIYSEAWYTTAMVEGAATIKVEQPSISARQGSRKVVRTNSEGGFRYQYYDLASDPDERSDLYPSQPQAVADLRELLATYEPLMSGLRRSAEAARARFSKSPALPPQQVDIDPAVEEKLRALGYVE